jgi:DNA-binding CsgD family transcriptional regulator/tetratricopeptide (TPR) repeat protein
VVTRPDRGDDGLVQLMSHADATEALRLVERREELAALDGALAGVKERSRGRFALVRGEAGIGKTVLLTHFCAGLGPAVRILWAACEPLFTPRPLGPLLDVSRVTGGEFEDNVERGARPHDVAAALLRELEAPAPTVLVLEDVQWADEATLDVLRLVARRTEAVPALIVASYRDEELDRSHPLRLLLGELPGNGSIARVELSAFTPQAVASLAEGSAIDPDELFERTAGNPFFVTEALAAKTDHVPSTVRDAVLARASRLGSSARAVLDAVAVVPHPTELWLLEALTEVAPGALAECLSSGMLRAEANSVAFRHELARLAIEGSLAPDVRLDLHRRALAALAEPASGTPDLARLAHHAEAAGDGESVLRFAPAAAEHASSVGAHREAQDQYARALRFATEIPPEARANLLERFADEGYLTDMREEALEALDEALAIHRERGDLLRQGDALALRSRLLACTGLTQEASVAARDAVALEQGPAGRELARAYASLAQLSMFADEAEETVEWGLRAIELAERLGDTEALVHALNSVGTIELARGNPAGREKLERSLTLATQEELTTDVGRAYINLVAAFARRLEWTVADRYIGPGIEYCRERGLEAWQGHLVAGKAESDLVHGRWEDAAATADSILSGPPSSVVGPRFDSLIVLALARARRGEAPYRHLLDEALEMARTVDDLQALAPISAARAEAAWLEGKVEVVAAETDAALARAIELGEPSFIGLLANWRRRAGLEDELSGEVSEPYASELAGEHERAAELWTELGNPYEAALALTGSDDDAALRRSLGELQALGAEPGAAIVARRLRERGARGLPRGPRPSTKQNPAGLTAREIEVLELVAEGLRNADIGQRLFVSEKTVGHHVSSILHKLEVRTRGQASVEAQRLGITGRT